MNEWEWQLLDEPSRRADQVSAGGVELRKGDLVRLKPRQGGDILDLALAGQAAMIESIEQDFEGKLHLAVVLEDDPGKDLGVLRQPGHRFFFAPEEVEPLRRPSKILVAGIGNIFLGDDGFGCEVIRRLPPFPKNVTIRDFGIRGYDLAYALLDDYDVTILIDAASRGDVPGTVYLIEPEVSRAESSLQDIDAHTLNPARVLRLARSMGHVSGHILLVACEPADLGGEEGRMGLTERVSAAVDEAVGLVEKLVAASLSIEIENQKIGVANASDASK